MTDAYGSTATVKSIRPGVVLKKPWDFKTEFFISDARLKFTVEPLILERVGPHPRIVRYVVAAQSKELAYRRQKIPWACP